MNHWGLVAEACKVAVKARNLGWMNTIWVLHGPPWEVAGNCQVPQMLAATSPGPVLDGEM